MSIDQDDEIVFAGELDDSDYGGTPWKILIVDDEAEIHSVTKLALRDFHFRDRPLQFLNAYSGKESIEVVRENPDIAVILMDVVMETDDAGLRAIDRIRNELARTQVRIVLRTGQPGQAPEHDVVKRYDINDYKEKTELTAKKLFTLIYTSIGQYADLVRRDMRQSWLEYVIDASNTVFRRRSPNRLGSGIMRRAMALVGETDKDEDNPQRGGIAVCIRNSGEGEVLRAVGCHATCEGMSLAELPAPIAARLAVENPDERRWMQTPEGLIAWLQTRDGWSVRLLLTIPDMEVGDPQMLGLFFDSAVIALTNARLTEQIDQAQRELVLMLGEAIEKRSLEAGNHVRRVGEYCRVLGLLAGLSFEDADMLGVAAPLHDAGKIAIPDAILNKPGRHTEAESEIMRNHAAIGGDIFSTNEMPILQAAAIVANEHHERWDGMGYPNRLAGEEIHIYGRIAAIADVFDALFSRRCYKEAWATDDVLEAIRGEAGKHFDPKLTALFLDHIEDFLAIRRKFPDQEDPD